MDRTQGDSASTSRTVSGDDVFSQIMGDIDTIASVLDSVVDAPKERLALKEQLSGFKNQIGVLETHVKKKLGTKSDSRPSSLDVSLTSLQRNVDLVSRSLGIDPLWNSSEDSRNRKVVADEPPAPKESPVVSLYCWRFKLKAKKLLRAPAGCKNIRAFSLRSRGVIKFMMKDYPEIGRAHV